MFSTFFHLFFTCCEPQWGTQYVEECCDYHYLCIHCCTFRNGFTSLFCYYYMSLFYRHIFNTFRVLTPSVWL